jgi:hypothetical protein
MATPDLSLVPALSTTYNVGMAETFSWVPMQGLDRPLFARATYLANASDISVSLSANDIVLNIDEVEDLLKESITLLNALTAKSVDIDVNTDEVEGLIRESNTLLDGLTAVDYSTSAKQDITNTLLNVLTASTDSLENNTDEVGVKIDTVIGLLSAQLGQQGFDFIVSGQTASSGPYTTVQIASAAKISAISAGSSTIGQLTAFELPANFSFNGPITSITLEYGAAFVYKL